MKIRYQVFYLFLFFLILIAGLGWYVLKISEGVLEEAINEETLVKATSMMEQIDKSIYDRIEIFKEYTRDLIFQDAILSSQHRDPECRNKDTKRLVGLNKAIRLKTELKEKLGYYEEKYGYPLFLKIDVFDRCDRVVASVGNNGHARKTISKENPEVSEGPLLNDTGEGVAHIDTSFLMSDLEGRTIGRVDMVIDLRGILNDMEKRFRRDRQRTNYPSMEFYLADGEGNLIYSSTRSPTGKDISWMYGKKREKSGKDSGFSLAHDTEGPLMQYAHIHSTGYADYEGTGWGLIIEHSVNEVFYPIHILRNTILLILIGVLLLGVGAAFLASRLISKPIIRLKEAASKIAEGEFEAVDLKTYGEVGELINTFNKMAEELRDARIKLIEEMHLSENARLELRENEERLDAITNSAQDTIIMLDPAKRIVFCNPATSKLLGYPKKELLGMGIDQVIVPRCMHKAQEAGIDIFAKGNGEPILGRTLELFVFDKTGEEISVELSISSVFYKAQWHLIGIMRDVSDRPPTL